MSQVLGGITVYDPTSSLQGATTTPVATDAISLVRLGTFTGTGATRGGRAESIAFDVDNGQFFTTNAAADRVDYATITPAGGFGAGGSLALAGLPGYGEVNAVAVKNGVVAVAYQNLAGDQAGYVALYDAATHAFIKTVQVGVLPDQLTFTPDGSKLLVANEGEALESANNPAGSVSVIDLSAGPAAAAVIGTIDFSALNGFEDELRDAGVQIYPGFTAGLDIEPEYISVAPDGTHAYVTLQEVSAVAVIDLAANQLIAVQPLGFLDHTLAGNAFDPTDDDDAPTPSNLDIRGLLQPDAIATFEVDGVTYFVTANEGDARVGDDIEDTDIDRLEDVDLDPDAFPNAEELQDSEIGRLNVFTQFGDTDGDGDLDQLYTLGGRGISIFRQEADGSITKVRETGGEFEAIIARDHPEIYNQNQGNLAVDSRSDDKGPEPEGVTIGVVDDRIYAFVALERTGGIMVYDVTDPAEASFVQYMPPVRGLDDGPEVVTFVSAGDSPTGHPLLLSANEISGTVTLYQVAIQAPGSKADDFISGSAGGDQMNGGPGADTVIGLGGADNLQGQSGADVFLYTSAEDGGDTITGFAQGDRIGLIRSGFGLGADADFDHGVAFVGGKSPVATGDGPALLFDAKTADLYFDADGAGGQDATLLAHINGQPLSTSDFVFI